MITRSDDVAALARLRRAWGEESGDPGGEDGFDERFAEWFRAESGHRLTWLAHADGAPVGMLNLLEFRRMPRPGRPPTCWGYVANVFVLAAHRNAGLGSRLVTAAIAEARDRGYARLVLSPSERAEPLYRRFGFRDADELLVLPLTTTR